MEKLIYSWEFVQLKPHETFAATLHSYKTLSITQTILEEF